MALILAAAFVLRAWLALAFPSYDTADEIFQAPEQAHRLIFGYGVVP
ncbi:MAG: hypothetical protein WDM94_11815 [Bauldia sp.]